MTEYKEMYEVLAGIMAEDHVQEMKRFIQHGTTSTYEHCESVAKLSYKIDKKLSLGSDLSVLLPGAMLHDFYLYDWHEEGDGTHHLHGFSHAERAAGNAKEYFDIDEATSHVIRSHMWPLNLSRVPRTREAWIVCIADKWISFQESLFRRKP